LAQWLGVTFVVLSTWQMSLYLFSEYVTDSRSWGLLSVPLWMPQVPIVAGLAVFLMAMLKRMHDEASELSPLRFRAFAPWLVIAGCGLALAIGNSTVETLGVRINVGMPLIAVFCVLGAALTNGFKTASILALILAVGAFAFVAAAESSTLVVGLVVLGTVLVLLSLGMEVALGLGLAGLLGLAFLLPLPQLTAVADRYWNGINSFTYAAVPMFILMGSILMRSGITGSLFTALAAWTGRLPGGLAHATIGAGGIFAAFSGSSIATAATIGKTAGEEMMSRGYSPRISMGAIAGGGTLGILIPPSIPLIIYGAMVGAPVTQLFAAGMIPGLMALLSMMLLVFAWAKFVPGSTGATRRYSWREKTTALVSVLPFMALIIGVFSVLYLGIATPTEAGAVGAAMSALIAALKGRLNVKMLGEALSETAILTSAVLVIVVGAGILGWIVDYARIPQALVSFVEAQDLTPWVLMLCITIVYIVLGMFIDPISMILMTVSMTFPIVALAGYDEIWFGIALMIVIEIGLITPPVGIILFVLRGISAEVSFRDIVMGALPFVAILLLNLLLIAVFPEIVHWLPDQIQ
jgi:tripartite ATP-independent transporter DctM subunit